MHHILKWVRKVKTNPVRFLFALCVSVVTLKIQQHQSMGINPQIGKATKESVIFTVRNCYQSTSKRKDAVPIKTKRQFFFPSMSKLIL